MLEPIHAGATRFRALNRAFFILSALAIGAIGCVILVYAVIVLSGRVKSGTVLIALLLTWLPCPFYLWALWTLSGLFRQLSRGVDFPLTIPAALSRVGWALTLGAALTLALTVPIDRFSHPHRLGNFAVFDVPALTIGLVGLALLVVGIMLQRAARIEAEAKALKATLEGFV